MAADPNGEVFTMRMAALALGVLAATPGWGCGGGGAAGGTPGEKGKAEFSYQGAGCFFGCPLEQPLLSGTRTSIAVTGPGDARGVEVVSSKPAVADFALERSCYCERKDGGDGHLQIAEDASCDGIWVKHCDNTVLVLAKDAGQTRLELRDADGALIDQVPVLVHQATRVTIEATYQDRLGAEKTTGVQLVPGASVQIDATLYDADGRVLLAPEGVQWSVADDSVATVTAFLLGSGKQIDAGTSVVIDAVAAGTTTLTLSVPGLEQAIGVDVQPSP